MLLVMLQIFVGLLEILQQNFAFTNKLASNVMPKKNA